jgi:hypothetical protein
MKTKRGLITVLIVTVVAAALMVPLIGDVAVEAQGPQEINGNEQPAPAPVGGIVEAVDQLELGAISGESSNGASNIPAIALGIGMTALFSAFLIWAVRRRHGVSEGER